MPKPTKAVVLVADDEPSTRALVAGHLRSKGYKVIEAGDGDEAWELAHEHLPHAVVLDVMMPGMSGWEVCRKIREAVSLAHTGVVMLTGIGENLNELTSPLYGADAYVDKPFEFGDLDQKLAETLARRTGGAVGRPDRADQQSAAQVNGQPRGERAKPAPRAKSSAKKLAAKAAKPVKSATKPLKAAAKAAKKLVAKVAKKIAAKGAKKPAAKQPPAKKSTAKVQPKAKSAATARAAKSAKAAKRVAAKAKTVAKSAKPVAKKKAAKPKSKSRR